MLRRSIVLALVVLTMAGWLFAADRAQTVTIMTQNMDAATDQGYIVAAALGLAPLTVAEAVDLTFAEIQASNLEGRAGLLADKIAREKPDIVALQEITFWQASLSSGPVVYDQLALLLSALKGLDAPYNVVALNPVNDVTLPGSQVPALRMVDRNALLVRADARPPALHFSDVHTHIYAASLPFIGLNVAAGWISASVHTGNRHFVLAATHLQSNVPGVPEATAIQVAQAQELLNELRHVVVPVVICGDFNSDANNNPAVIDFSPTANLIQAAGYPDTWPVIHGSDPGNTWPLYLEDQVPIAFTASDPFERIDLVFSRDMEVIAADRVIAAAPSGTPPFASDHAGIIVRLKP
jgi:endonuclease/exonuclease/phosphatase family metal-dependent hydrolase